MLRAAMTRIRKARPDEFAALEDIERIADRRYATVGLDIVLDMPVSHQWPVDGPVWVAVDEADKPIGFVLAAGIEGYAYIDQLSVLPEHGRKGIGGALIATVLDWARTTSAKALILSTYREVAWNQPFYEKHGFVEMPESEWNAEIRHARAHEAAVGHDLSRRMFMWRKLR